MSGIKKLLEKNPNVLNLKRDLLKEKRRAYYERAIKSSYDKLDEMAKEYVNFQEDRFGEESITFRDFIRRLGSIIGEIVFETAMASKKMKSMIVAFGRSLIYNLEKVGFIIVVIPSKVKEIIKKRQKN